MYEYDDYENDAWLKMDDVRNDKDFPCGCLVLTMLIFVIVIGVTVYLWSN